MNSTETTQHEREKYEYIAQHREEFNGYGGSAHGQGILQRIKKLCPESVCDVGTAAGNFCLMLKQAGVPVVIGVDFAFSPCFDPDNEGITWVNACAQDIPLPDKSVDYITAFDFMEHLPEADVSVVLDEFERIARRGMFFTVSHSESWHTVNGENLHLTIQPPRWWMDRFEEHGTVERVEKFFVVTLAGIA